jgi:hypothetical protein
MAGSGERTGTRENAEPALLAMTFFGTKRSVRCPAGPMASGPSENSEEERHRSAYARARVSSRCTSTKDVFRNSL